MGIELVQGTFGDKVESIICIVYDHNIEFIVPCEGMDRTERS